MSQQIKTQLHTSIRLYRLFLIYSFTLGGSPSYPAIYGGACSYYTLNAGKSHVVLLNCGPSSLYQVLVALPSQLFLSNIALDPLHFESSVSSNYSDIPFSSYPNSLMIVFLRQPNSSKSVVPPIARRTPHQLRITLIPIALCERTRATSFHSTFKPLRNRALDSKGLIQKKRHGRSPKWTGPQSGILPESQGAVLARLRGIRAALERRHSVSCIAHGSDSTINSIPDLVSRLPRFRPSQCSGAPRLREDRQKSRAFVSVD